MKTESWLYGPSECDEEFKIEDKDDVRLKMRTKRGCRVSCKDCRKRRNEEILSNSSWENSLCDNIPETHSCEKCRALAARKKRNERIKASSMDFFRHSTFHGFKLCIGEYPRWRKIAWTLIVIATIALFVEKFTESMLEYYRYPFSTVTILQYNTTLTFPAVTICNYNDVRLSVMNGSLPDKAFIMKMKYGKQDERYLSIRDNLTDKDMGVLALAPHRPEELIYDCMWKNSEPCSYRNFTRFNTVEGDTCYTINGETQSEILTVEKTGMKNGLRLTLHSQMFEYYYDVKKAGFSIILHDQNETPFRMQGFSVPPGLVTFVELKLTKIKNLEPPFKTRCGDPSLKYFGTYSRSKCFLDTLTQYVVKKCGCREWFMPDTSVPVCPTFNAFVCVWENWEYFETNKLFYDKCPVSCELTEYETAMSYAMFPANSYADEWAQNESIPGASRAAKRKFLRDNFLEVVIYYEDLSYYLVNQVPTYDIMNCLGDIGGQIGLFLGASSLTALEVLDYFFVLFRIFYSSGFKRSKEDKKDKAEAMHLNETPV